MSIEVAGLALRAQTGLGTQAKLVLIGLADHAHADGSEARPSVRTLAQYAECSERTVQRHLKALVAAGIITVQRKPAGHHATCYRIRLPELAALRPAPSTDTVSPQGDQPDSSALVMEVLGPQERQADTGDTPVTPGVTIATPRGDTVLSPEPSLEPTVLEPSEDQKAAAPLVDPNPNQPLETQIYIGEKIGLSIPAIVKLNRRWGRRTVLEAMRHVHGFPPPDGVENSYAYVQTLCELAEVAS